MPDAALRRHVIFDFAASSPRLFFRHAATMQLNTRLRDFDTLIFASADAAARCHAYAISYLCTLLRGVVFLRHAAASLALYAITLLPIISRHAAFRLIKV